MLVHLCISSSPFSSIAPPPSSIQLFNGRHLMILLSWRSEWLNRHTARMCKILNFVQSNHQPHTPEHRRWKFILPITVFFFYLSFTFPLSGNENIFLPINYVACITIPQPIIEIQCVIVQLLSKIGVTIWTWFFIRNEQKKYELKGEKK